MNIKMNEKHVQVKAEPNRNQSGCAIDVRAAVFSHPYRTVLGEHMVVNILF